MRHNLRIILHYSQTYREIIGHHKTTFPFIQDLRQINHAPAAPDQPIKASSTYRLVRSSLRLTTNSRKKHAIN